MLLAVILLAMLWVLLSAMSVKRCCTAYARRHFPEGTACGLDVVGTLSNGIEVSDEARWWRWWVRRLVRILMSTARILLRVLRLAIRLDIWLRIARLAVRLHLW